LGSNTTLEVFPGDIPAAFSVSGCSARFIPLTHTFWDMLYHLLYHLQSWGKFDFYDTETRVYSERKLGKLSVSDQEMHSTIVGLGKLEDYSSDCGRYHCEADSCFEDMRDRKSQAGLNLHN
jgi:hypothetical protein